MHNDDNKRLCKCLTLSIDLGVRQVVIRPRPKYTRKNLFQRKLDADT